MPPTSYVNSKFQGKSPTGCYFVLRPLLQCCCLQLVFLKLCTVKSFQGRPVGRSCGFYAC